MKRCVIKFLVHSWYVLLLKLAPRDSAKFLTLLILTFGCSTAVHSISNPDSLHATTNAHTSWKLHSVGWTSSSYNGGLSAAIATLIDSRPESFNFCAVSKAIVLSTKPSVFTRIGLPGLAVNIPWVVSINSSNLINGSPYPAKTIPFSSSSRVPSVSYPVS